MTEKQIRIDQFLKLFRDIVEQNPDFEMKNINKEINEIVNTQNSFIESNIIAKKRVKIK